MNRIDMCFNKLKEYNKKALVCFLTGGDPDLKTAEELILKVSESGADIIEVGIPFSDPLADGPTIQTASFRSLTHGTTIRGVLECVKNVRQKSDVPIVLMTYFNPINKFGLESFAKESASHGADGVIITDLPVEEASNWKEIAEQYGLKTIFMLAPTSTTERITIGAKMASGFIYCVSRTGVTGAQSSVPLELNDMVSNIRNASDTPIVVGFGISNADHVHEISKFADGVVVGSALVKIVNDNVTSENYNEAELLSAVGSFVSSLKQGTMQE